MTFFLFFSHPNAWVTEVDLAVKRSRSFQVHGYTNFVELHSQMIHTKFQNHRLSGSREDDFQRFLLFIAMAAILVM